MTFATLLAGCLWKATFLLMAAFAANALLRRHSASLRHFVWTAAFVALLLLPAAILVEPRWAAMNVPQSVTVVTAVQSATESGPPVPDRPVLPLLWLAGCLAVALRFTIGAARTSWMVRTARQASVTTPEPIGRPVRFVYSKPAPMALVWGIFRPVVILPDDAPTWPEDRLATVVLHELMHIRRRDLLAQAIAQVACCLYWFHPLAWLAFGRLRNERERACDDAVLLRGIKPHDYAAHLVEIVRALREKRTGWIGAPAMAGTSDFESRVHALLDRTRNRGPLTRKAAVAVAAAIVAILLPVAAITARAQVDRGAIAGTVQDPTGARIPSSRIVIKNLDTGAQQSAIAGPAGEYQFVALPAGQYSVEVNAPGFQIMKRAKVTVPAGEAIRVDAHLELGRVSEVMTVRGQRPAAQPATPAPSGAARIRIGGMVQVAKLVQQVKPVYPPDLQAQGLEGSVELAAIISKDGRVINARVTKSAGTAFDEAAMNAVKQSVYQPALLNGEPVETVTNITIEFQLGQ